MSVFTRSYLLDAYGLQEAGFFPFQAKLLQLVSGSFTGSVILTFILAMTALSRAITIYSRPMLLYCRIFSKSIARIISNTETKSLHNKQKPSSQKSPLIKKVCLLHPFYNNIPLVPKDLRAKFPLYQILISICKVIFQVTTKSTNPREIIDFYVE